MKSNLFFIIVVLLLGACAEQKDPKAAFDHGDFETSFRLWKVQAEAGDAHAQNYIGIHYYLGLGVPRNFSKALEWYGRAANVGDINAQHNLGLMYEAGQGVERDFEKAFVWLYAAHRQGNKNAAAALDTLINKLSPNNKMQLRKVARNFIFNEVLGPDDDDY
jgi:TPR repeat protein